MARLIRITVETLKGSKHYSFESRDIEPINLDKILPKIQGAIKDLGVDYGFDVKEENW